ncbi:MAG: PAS domain S-box protein, partial [Rhodospirillales bacterium]|nr:PAS domain S-box protein [Rhodospirillales bacterium]
MSREGSRILPAIEILKLSALSLCAGMLGVGSWEFFIEHVIPSDSVLRDTFWWEMMEIGFISSVFATLTVPMWLRAVRNLNLARAEVTQSVSILGNIFHATPGLCAISDSTTGTHIDVSERWLSALGYQRKEVIGKTASELHIWPTAKTRNRLFKEMERTNGHLRDYETQICSKSGVTIDVLVSGERIVYEGQERLFLIAQDISAHKRADRELRESERRARAAEQLLKDAIESISDGFVLYGADSGLIICNKKFKELYGYSNVDVAPGATWATLGELDIKRGTVLSDNEREYLDRRDINEGPPKSFPVRLADGRSILVRDRKTLNGGIVSIQTDVTATESLLEELRHAHAELEERVAERTKDLELEIVERKTAEIKLRDALTAVQVA